MLLVVLSAASFSQQTNPAPQLTNQDYLQKSKKQKTTAWILLAGGAALSITGAILSSHTLINILIDPLNPESTSGSDADVIVLLTGAAAMLGSVPLFISAGKNKRKAMSLSFKMEQVPQLQIASLVNKPTPSVSLKIKL